jgi:hypothetical protein
VEENEGMNQSQALGIGQALIHKSIFRARYQTRASGHIHSDKTGVAIIEGIGEIG